MSKIFKVFIILLAGFFLFVMSLVIFLLNISNSGGLDGIL
ncbi:Uncharacterised protein [Campylobacter jejuni]|nr:Uncharacterised protein [Campylobacter jejuni]